MWSVSRWKYSMSEQLLSSCVRIFPNDTPKAICYTDVYFNNRWFNIRSHLKKRRLSALNTYTL